MKVDFNNVRKQACLAHDRLVSILDNGKCVEEDSIGEYIEGYGRLDKDTIILDVEQLEDVMNDLRMKIGTIAMCSDGSDDVKTVYEELYPENNPKKRMKEFNLEP